MTALVQTLAAAEYLSFHRAARALGTSSSITARLSDAPQDIPDIHPGIAETFRRRIERLIAALDHPDGALEAADAIREVIDRIIIITSDNRHGSYGVTLQGELGSILEWIERTGKPGYRSDPVAAPRLSTSVKTWPWVGRVADVRGKHLTPWRMAITYLPFFSA